MADPVSLPPGTAPAPTEPRWATPNDVPNAEAAKVVAGWVKSYMRGQAHLPPELVRQFEREVDALARFASPTSPAVPPGPEPREAARQLTEEAQQLGMYDPAMSDEARAIVAGLRATVAALTRERDHLAEYVERLEAQQGALTRAVARLDAANDQLAASERARDAARRHTLLAVCEAYGGDPADPVWSTPEGVAGVIEDLSGQARANAARFAAAEIAAEAIRALGAPGGTEEPSHESAARYLETQLGYFCGRCELGDAVEPDEEEGYVHPSPDPAQPWPCHAAFLRCAADVLRHAVASPAEPVSDLHDPVDRAPWGGTPEEEAR